MNHLSPLVNVLNKSIRVLGKKLIRDFNEIEILQSSIKNTEKFAKISISNLEKDICNFLKKIKPNIGIYKNHNIQDEDCWIINCVDSLKNFSRGIDNFFINISLREKKKITTSVLYNPIKDENYYFQNGLGGYKNDSRIRVSERKDLSESIFTFYDNSKINNAKILDSMRKKLRKELHETRISGSICTDLCLLVSGKIDCAFLHQPGDNLKDISRLILSETGGIFTEANFQEKVIYILSNKYIGKLVKEMIENNNENC